MTNTKSARKISLRIISALTLIVVFITCTMVFADATTSGTTGTGTIVVNTKANYALPGSSSITLKQTKGTYTYTKYSLFGKATKKTDKGYAYYNITATPISGKGSKKTATLSGSSKTISLDKNTTYKVTVSFDSSRTWLNNNCRDITWQTKPSWKVSSTWKVSSYY
jgi:hypothetical protein